ncbi:MAG: hypothetical protein KDA33_14380 [Phycisphaerales bacterium]|nr:hypothetical protein [Phycisphaerales bacterium]
MPAYIVCPHCQHPTVISVTFEARRYRCRQCNGVFVVRQTEASARSSDRSVQEAHARAST